MTPEHLNGLYTLGISNIKLGLSNIQRLLEKLGDLHKNPKIIHFAGTNGKGSTLVTLETLLLKSGYTVGSTTSPHLISFNERFRINGVSVDDESLGKAFLEVCNACGIDPDRFKETASKGTIQPTFFEFAIALAFVLFRMFQVEYILLETGLGGRLDATNVIKNPLACVLTRIDIDHQEYLGETLEEITNEKLGIVKEGATIFVAKQQQSVRQQVLEYCEKRNATVQCFENDFGYRRKSDRTQFYGNNCGDQEIGLYQLSTDFIGLQGEHQKENVSTALALYYHIVSQERLLPESEIIDSLQTLRWDARLQYLNREKTVLLDGAHNESGMQALIQFLKQNHKDQQVLFALCWMQEKRFLEILEQELSSDQVTFQPLEMKFERAMKGDGIRQELETKGFSVHPTLSVTNLVKDYKNGDLPKHDLLVIAGSLYLAGEFLEVWNTDTSQ